MPSETASGTTNLQAQVLLRANDPIYELALIFGGHRKENKFWEHTLTAVARIPRRRGSRRRCERGVRRQQPAMATLDERVAQRRDSQSVPVDRSTHHDRTVSAVAHQTDG